MLTPGPPEPTPAAGSPPGEPAAPPGDRARARRTFVGFFTLYLLFAWPAPLDPIAGRHLALAEAMARGRVGVGPLERDIAGDLSLTPLPDGTFPPHHFGPGASVLAAPICAVVQALAPAPHEEHAAEVRRRAAVRLCEVSLVLALLVAPLGAATVVLLARLLERAGLPRPWEAAYAWGLGLSFPLSTTFGPHVVGLGLAVAGVFLATSPARWPLGSFFGGFLVGASVLCDPGFALVAAAPVAVWLTWRLGRDVWPFASGAAATGALFVVRNAVYYGHPLRPRAPFDALPVSLREGGRPVLRRVVVDRPDHRRRPARRGEDRPVRMRARAAPGRARPAGAMAPPP